MARRWPSGGPVAPPRGPPAARVSGPTREPVQSGARASTFAWPGIKCRRQWAQTPSSWCTQTRRTPAEIALIVVGSRRVNYAPPLSGRWGRPTSIRWGPAGEIVGQRLAWRAARLCLFAFEWRQIISLFGQIHFALGHDQCVCVCVWKCWLANIGHSQQTQSFIGALRLPFYLAPAPSHHPRYASPSANSNSTNSSTTNNNNIEPRQSTIYHNNDDFCVLIVN